MTALYPILCLMAFAFVLNLPLGHLRVRCSRFSLRWFICIHLSIPLIVVARHQLGYGWELVPFTLACAVLGQIIGARWRPPVVTLHD